MNKILKIFLLGFISFNYMNCKENPKEDAGISTSVETPTQTTENNTVTETSQGSTSSSTDPFLLETPAGYYEPKGLKKLSILEMYKLGTSPEFKKDFQLRDKDGKDLSWEVMERMPAEKPVFMQMWADENGKVVEGVVFPITEEVKALIAKARMVAK